MGASIHQLTSGAIEIVGRLMDPLPQPIGSSLIQKTASGIGLEVVLEAFQEAPLQLSCVVVQPLQHGRTVTAWAIEVADELPARARQLFEDASVRGAVETISQLLSTPEPRTRPTSSPASRPAGWTSHPATPDAHRWHRGAATAKEIIQHLLADVLGEVGRKHRTFTR